MKNLLLALVLILSIVTIAQARDTCISSGILVADTIVTAGYGELCGLDVTADNTNASECKVYDNATGASGTVLAHVIVDATLRYESRDFTTPIRFKKGLYLDWTTNSSCIVYYRK